MQPAEVSDLRAFANELRSIRSALGMDLRALSLQCDVSELVLSKLEQAELWPTPEQLAALARILQTDPQRWLGLAQSYESGQQATLLETRIGALDSASPIRSSLPSGASFQAEAATQGGLSQTVRTGLVGKTVRGYQFLEHIGEGGFGAVYRALQISLGRDVAIKIVKPELADDADFIRRFEAEAELVARLEHPNIVPLYDFWREPGAAFMVMRYLRGGSLAQHLKAHSGGQLSLKILPVLRQVGQALQVAHRAGVIHRDLKPANILLDEQGNACLADFGVAKQLANDSGRSVLGEMVGSLAYAAPEQLRGLSVSQAADIYAFAVMSFELLAGRRPFLASDAASQISKHLHEAPPLLSELVSGIPLAVDQVLLRGLAKEPEQRQEDALSFVAELESALRGIEPGWKAGSQIELGDAVATTTVDSRSLNDLDNPYRGLAAFDEGDARNFFGRESLIDELLRRLGGARGEQRGEQRHDPLGRALVVVGASGSGKSSVIRAGLVPALRSGALPGSRRWLIITMVPGQDPFENMAAALRKVAVHALPIAELLRSDSYGIARAIDRLLPHEADCELLLVVDQFEELFTQVADESVRRAWISALTTALLDAHSRLRVILTLRADFLDRPLQYPELAQIVRTRSVLVPAMSLDELERAIVGPARRLGLIFEPGLVTHILDEVRDQVGALPLLQYALSELYLRRQGRELRLAAFRNMGGVSGALAGRAEAAFLGLPRHGQELLRQVFLRLTTLGEGREDTRRRAQFTEINALGVSCPEDLQQAIEAFARERLLSFDRDDVSHANTLEVAHEALLRSWSRLKDWLNDARADLRLQRQLADSGELWRQNREDASFLLGGARLEQFRHLSANQHVQLTQSEHDYLVRASEAADAVERAESERQERELAQAQALAEQEKRSAELALAAAQTERRGNRRLRYLVAGLVVIVAFALWQTQQLVKRSKDLIAQTVRTEAEAQSALALSEFWQALFATADPNRSKGKDLSVRDVLDSGVKKINSELNEVPLSKARLLLTIARTYRQLQDLDAADHALQGADAGLADADQERELRMDIAHERVRVAFDRKQFPQAIALVQQAEVLEQAFGAPVLVRAITLNMKAGILNAQGDFAAAAGLLDRVLKMRRDHGAAPNEVATTLNNLAFALVRDGELEAARSRFAEAYQIKRTQLGAAHVETALMLLNLAKAERDLGQFEAANQHMGEVHATLEKLYPDPAAPHPALAILKLDLAVSLRMQGDLKGALTKLTDSCSQPDACPLSWQREYAATLLELSRLDQAKLALERCRELSGTRSERCDWRLAYILAKQGRREAAVTQLKAAISGLDASKPQNIERAQAALLLAELSPDDAAAAKQEARLLLQQNPDYWLARKLLGELK